jgi:hypothetical protein
VVDDEAKAVREPVVRLAGRAVGTEQLRRRSAAAQSHEHPGTANGHEPCGSEPIPHDACGTPLPYGVDDHRGRERRREDGGLEPRRRREQHRPDNRRLESKGRPNERFGHGPRREDDDGIEGDLGHDQAGVGEIGNRKRQRRGCERPRVRGQRACPEEHRDGREGDDDRLDCLERAVAMLDVADAEGQARDQRREEAVEPRGLAEDLELPRFVEALAELRVDGLVGEDPRDRDSRRGPEAKRARRRDEHDEPAPGRDVAESCHAPILVEPSE